MHVCRKQWKSVPLIEIYWPLQPPSSSLTSYWNWKHCTNQNLFEIKADQSPKIQELIEEQRLNWGNENSEATIKCRKLNWVRFGSGNFTMIGSSNFDFSRVIRWNFSFSAIKIRVLMRSQRERKRSRELEKK